MTDGIIEYDEVMAFFHLFNLGLSNKAPIKTSKYLSNNGSTRVILEAASILYDPVFSES